MSKKDIQNVDKEEVLEVTEELLEEDDLLLIADEIDETEDAKSEIYIKPIRQPIDACRVRGLQ